MYSVITDGMSIDQWRTEGGGRGGGGAAAPGAGGRGRQNGHQSTGARERFFQ
jgi:hypothetical protein